PAGGHRRRGSHLYCAPLALAKTCPHRYRFRVPRLPDADHGELPAFNIFRQLNHAPKVAGAYARMGGMLLARADLDPKLRELVINAISLALDCDYEWSHHGKWALDVGNTPDDLQALKDRDYS